MNASSLYVTVLRLVLQNDFQNIFRLFPYLRQSLSCTVCGNLLSEPYSPLNSPCQHHECKRCIGGRKILKPSCSWCRDYRGDSVQNVQLRLLLQCYKSLCEYIKLTPIYEGMQCQVQINSSASAVTNGNATSGGTGNHSDGVTNRLADIIDEGIRFNDEFKSTAGLSKATYSMLPCLYQAIPVAPPPVATPSPPPIVPPPSLPPAPSVVVASVPAITATSVQQQLPLVLKSTQIQIPVTVNQRHPVQQQQMPSSSSFKQISISSPLPVSTIGGGGGGNANVLQPGGSILVTKASSSPHSSNSSSSSSSNSTSIIPPMPIIKTVSNGSALYSVMYAGSGNKITIKRKTDSQSTSSSAAAASSVGNQQLIANQIHSTDLSKSEGGVGGDLINSSIGGLGGLQKVFNASGMQGTTTYNSSTGQYQQQDFKKPPVVMKSKALAKRKGCRCGNATLTPGKLTCCGQRCPCYVESKSCIDCKCRGCRNPHRPNGFKVRPHIPELENLDFHLNAVEQQQQPIMKVVLGTLGSGHTGNRMDLDGNDYKFSNAGNNDEGGNAVRLENNGNLIAQQGSMEMSNLATEINVQSFQMANLDTTAGNSAPGKMQVLSVYSAPSNMTQVTSTLPTIIMSGGTTSSGNNFGSTAGVSTTTIQLQQPNQSYVNSFGQSNNVSTFNLTGNLVPSTNVTFQSLFGEDLLTGGSGSSPVVGESITTLDEDDLEGTTGGVIIGSYGTDEDDDELSHSALQLNGVDLLDAEESDEDGASGDILDV